MFSLKKRAVIHSTDQSFEIIDFYEVMLFRLAFFAIFAKVGIVRRNLSGIERVALENSQKLSLFWKNILRE